MEFPVTHFIDRTRHKCRILSDDVIILITEDDVILAIIEDGGINYIHILHLYTGFCLNSLHYSSIIPRLPFVDSTTLLKNHCHSIPFLDLLSLEVNLTKDELRRIRQYDANFRIGWLHDEVINSYFSVMYKSQAKVLSCGTTEALLISHGKSFRRLWKNESIQKDSVIIIPFNPTGYHWIFIQIDLRNRRRCIIDPLRDDIDKGSETFVKVLFLIKCILQNKFGFKLESFNFEKVDPPLQNNSISCGVMVCYYAKRFAQGNAFVLTLL